MTGTSFHGGSRFIDPEFVCIGRKGKTHWKIRLFIVKYIQTALWYKITEDDRHTIWE